MSGTSFRAARSFAPNSRGIRKAFGRAVNGAITTVGTSIRYRPSAASTEMVRLRRLNGCYPDAALGFRASLLSKPRWRNRIARAPKHTHGRYASYWNVSHTSSGHVWQGRYYSCPLDSSHLWEALRYTELNPVRAGLVIAPQEWKWSSAVAHCGATTSDASLEMEQWRKRWTASEWREYLEAGESEADLATLRQCTHTGRPLGSPEFIEGLEKSMRRRLAPQKGGRPERPIADARQTSLTFKQ